MPAIYITAMLLYVTHLLSVVMARKPSLWRHRLKKSGQWLVAGKGLNQWVWLHSSETSACAGSSQRI